MTAKVTTTKKVVEPLDIDTQRVIQSLENNGQVIQDDYITDGSIRNAVGFLQQANFIEPLLNLINSPQVIGKKGIVSNLRQIGLRGFEGGFFGELQLASNYLEEIRKTKDRQTVVQVVAMPAQELGPTLAALGFKQAEEIIREKTDLGTSQIGGDLTLWKMDGDKDLAEFIQFKAVDREENIKDNVKAAKNQLLGTGQEGQAGLYNAEQTIPHPNFKGVIHVQLKENTEKLAKDAKSYSSTAFEGTEMSASGDGGIKEYVHELRFTNISGVPIDSISTSEARKKRLLTIGDKQGERQVQAVEEATYLEIRKLGVKAIEEQSKLEKQRLREEAAAAKQFKQKEFQKQLESRGTVDLSQYDITDDVRKLFNDLIDRENEGKEPLSGDRFLTDILDDIKGLVAKSSNKSEDVEAWVNTQISQALQTVGEGILETFESDNDGLKIQDIGGDSITEYIEYQLDSIPNKLQQEVRKVKPPTKDQLKGFSNPKGAQSGQSSHQKKEGKSSSRKGKKNVNNKWFFSLYVFA